MGVSGLLNSEELYFIVKSVESCQMSGEQGVATKKSGEHQRLHIDWGMVEENHFISFVVLFKLHLYYHKVGCSVPFTCGSTKLTNNVVIHTMSLPQSSLKYDFTCGLALPD